MIALEYRSYPWADFKLLEPMGLVKSKARVYP